MSSNTARELVECVCQGDSPQKVVDQVMPETDGEVSEMGYDYNMPGMNVMGMMGQEYSGMDEYPDDMPLAQKYTMLKQKYQQLKHKYEQLKQHQSGGGSSHHY